MITALFRLENAIKSKSRNEGFVIFSTQTVNMASVNVLLKYIQVYNMTKYKTRYKSAPIFE